MSEDKVKKCDRCGTPVPTEDDQYQWRRFSDDGTELETKTVCGECYDALDYGGDDFDDEDELPLSEYRCPICDLHALEQWTPIDGKTHHCGECGAMLTWDEIEQHNAVDDLDPLSSMARAIKDEERERRLDNEASAARIKELEEEIAALKAKLNEDRYVVVECQGPHGGISDYHEEPGVELVILQYHIPLSEGDPYIMLPSYGEDEKQPVVFERGLGAGNQETIANVREALDDVQFPEED